MPIPCLEVWRQDCLVRFLQRLLGLDFVLVELLNHGPVPDSEVLYLCCYGYGPNEPWWVKGLAGGF